MFQGILLLRCVALSNEILGEYSFLLVCGNNLSGNRVMAVYALPSVDPALAADLLTGLPFLVVHCFS